MDKSLLNVISQPLFWILSALLSIVLSVLANLLTPQVAKFIDKYSDRRRTRTQRKQIAVAAKVFSLHGNPNRLTQAKLDTLQYLLIACVIMLFGLFPLLLFPVLTSSLILLRLFFVCFGAGVFVAGAALCNRAMDEISTIRLAEGRERDSEAFRVMESPSEEQLETFQRKWDQQHIGISVYDMEKKSISTASSS